MYVTLKSINFVSTKSTYMLIRKDTASMPCGKSHKNFENERSVKSELLVG